MTTARLYTLSIVVALGCALSACKRDKPAEPPKPTVTDAKPAATRTKEKAMAALLELPEVKSWSAQVEKSSRGAAHAAIVEDDPEPRLINGKKYWQFSLVENRRDEVHRKLSFLAAQADDEILVDDVDTDTVVSLDDWRRTIHRVDIKAAP